MDSVLTEEESEQEAKRAKRITKRGLQEECDKNERWSGASGLNKAHPLLACSHCKHPVVR